MWFLGVIVLIVLIGFAAFTGAPYVPSKRSDLAVAFEKLYPLNDKDVLVDIGSGDGVVLREASRRGAQAVGYEIHPVLVLLSKWLSRRDTRVRVRLANFWYRPLPNDVTVVYTFGEGRDIAKMYTRVQNEADRIGHQIAFISYAFKVPGILEAVSSGAHYLYLYCKAFTIAALATYNHKHEQATS